jgi:dCMP deaminase
MARPKGTKVWKPIPKDILWEWYWGELLTPKEIAEKWGEDDDNRLRDDGVWRSCPTDKWVTNELMTNGIPLRTPSERARLWQQHRDTKHERQPNRGYRKRYENHYNVTLTSDDHIHHKDDVKDNDHPLNLERLSVEDHTRLTVKSRVRRNGPCMPERIPLFEVYMRMAENIALRSHHGTAKIGCVIVSFDLRRVLSTGFNGNATGLSNESDNDEPGKSGLIHAEENALICAGEHGTDRVAFITESPCLQCSKLLLNAGVKYVYYRKEYRDAHPLKILKYMGVMVCQYNKWEKITW